MRHRAVMTGEWLVNDMCGVASFVNMSLACPRYYRRSHEDPSFAMLCGSMIRDCLSQPTLHRMYLFAPDASIPSMTVDLLKHLNSEHFEVSPSSCSTSSHAFRVNFASTE